MATLIFQGWMVLGALLSLVYAGLICYYHLLLRRLPLFVPTPGQSPGQKISVLIPARNEEDALPACLKSILANDYPAALFEIIVINDHSTDDTAAVVQAFALSHPAQVRLLNLADYTGGRPLNSYKKKAIELAVGMSSGTLMVTTDADCLVPPQWLHYLAACQQQNEAVLVAAPVNYTYNGKFSGLFQCLDFMSLQGITAASVAAGFHTMCNGANLAYNKAAFEAVGGFKGIDNIASGDDMLLMHKLARTYPGRIAFCHHPQAIVLTAPMPGWKSFFNQRIRWASKAVHYKDKKMFAVLVLVYLYNLYLLATPVLAIWGGVGVLVTGMLSLALKTIVEWAFMYQVSRFLGGAKWLRWFAVMQPLHIIYTVAAGWLGRFGKYTWKQRVVK